MPLRDTAFSFFNFEGRRVPVVEVEFCFPSDEVIFQLHQNAALRAIFEIPRSMHRYRDHWNIEVAFERRFLTSLHPFAA